MVLLWGGCHSGVGRGSSALGVGALGASELGRADVASVSGLTRKLLIARGWWRAAAFLSGNFGMGWGLVCGVFLGRWDRIWHHLLKLTNLMMKCHHFHVRQGREMLQICILFDGNVTACHVILYE